MNTTTTEAQNTESLPMWTPAVHATISAAVMDRKNRERRK